MKRIDKKQRQNKRGVALVVVLGFLTLMVTMAVMFVGRARVERLVGDSTLAAMSARSVLRTGIAHGMSAYSQMLWHDRIVMPAISDDDSYSVYYSENDGNSDKIGRDVDLLGTDGMDDGKERAYLWLPERYWDYSNDVANAYWIYQKAWDHAARKNRIVGRYAYAIFDVSGALDVNLLSRRAVYGFSNSTNRSNIRDFSEDAVNKSLDDVISISNVYYYVRNNVTNGVKAFGGFDSFFEMQENLSRAVDLDDLNNLVPYSMSAFRGTYFDTGDGTWTVPRDPEDLTQGDWEDLLAGKGDNKYNRPGHAMQDVLKGLTASDREAIAKAIMDFTSDDDAPQGLDYPSVKDVPMLNEIKFEISLEEDGPRREDEDKPYYSIYTLKLKLGVETWFPFPSSDNDGKTFKVPAPALKLVSGAGGGDDDTVTLRYTFQGLPSGYSITRPNLTEKAEKEEYSFNAGWGNDGTPQSDADAFVYSMRLDATCNGEDWPYGAGQLPPGLTLALQQQGKTVFTVKSGGTDVDKAELALVNKNLLKLQKGGKETTYWEVPDPRMNHLTDLWVVGDGSMGERNETAKQAIQKNLGISDEPESGDYAMYCRNGPMETPGDLGFIPTIGASEKLADAWKTLDLYSLDAAWLMRQLVSQEEAKYQRHDPIAGKNLMFPNSLPIYTNGTVNPNTPLTNVLQAAFADLKAEGIPGAGQKAQNTKPSLDPDDAKIIASRIIGYRSKGKYADEERQSLGAGYDFSAGSDWVTAFADATWHKNLENLFDRPKNVREGLVRQTWGLFRPEDNLFVMVVIGQAIKKGPDRNKLDKFDPDEDAIVGEKRAVLLVWRDPFPVDNGPHLEMSTILYKALTD
jgi:hypothetical protein